jgi:putative SOS response-associated peptidase YedK
MCYHLSHRKKVNTIAEYYEAELDDAEDVFEAEEHISGFEFSKIPIILLQEKKKLKLYNWGLIPSWIKDKTTALAFRKNTLNAKSETVFEKPSFKKAIETQRCIVPSTGFFEWQQDGKNKIPYYISLKEKEIISMAGLYDTWVDTETGEVINSVSILTTQANEVMSTIHNIKKRMPVLLDEQGTETWLLETLTQEKISSLCKPFNNNEMMFYKVDKQFKKIEHEIIQQQLF